MKYTIEYVINDEVYTIDFTDYKQFEEKFNMLNNSKDVKELRAYEVKDITDKVYSELN